MRKAVENGGAKLLCLTSGFGGAFIDGSPMALDRKRCKRGERIENERRNLAEDQKRAGKTF